jgi:hypothetical protein
MFKIIHDLSTLSEAERAQYCRDYASYLGLNPDENRIDTIWMNDNSVRTLVPYCRRGTTDILRGIHNIDIVDMVKEDGPGYVSFKAFGIDRRGRKEIAVGAFATAHLAGDKLAAAVATAETRAGRRLTLKFVGGGLLDESEVSNTFITEATPVAAPAVQPQTKPNAEVGKPVTEESLRVGFGARISDRPDSSETFPELAVPASVEAVNAILAKDTPATPAEPVKKTRKPRKSKNTVDMGDPQTGTIVPISGTSDPTMGAGSLSPLADIPESKQSLTYVPTCPVCNHFMAADDRLDLFLCIKDAQMHATMKPSMLKSGTPPPVVAPVPVVAPIPPPKPISLLSDIEQKQVKARLAPFWVDILPKGGMTADDGMSIWGKVIKFASLFFPDTPDHKNWTFDMWDSFFEFLDEYNAAHGPNGLVEYINGKINAA